MKVRNFSYGGFTLSILPGEANYEAEFLKWTDDPGIVVCKCSDGKTRTIPSISLEGFSVDDFPKQRLSKEALDTRSRIGIIPGIPCRS